MVDKKLVNSLDNEDANQTWEDVVQKLTDKGLKEDELYKKIIATSIQSRFDENGALVTKEEEDHGKVGFAKCSGSGKKVEYIFIGLDYYDDIDRIAEIFCEEFHMTAGEKLDGIWYIAITLRDDISQYQLYWHEDVGSCIYSVKQDVRSNEELERKLSVVVEKLKFKLNELIK